MLATPHLVCASPQPLSLELFCCFAFTFLFACTLREHAAYGSASGAGDSRCGAVDVAPDHVECVWRHDAYRTAHHVPGGCLDS